MLAIGFDGVLISWWQFLLSLGIVCVIVVGVVLVLHFRQRRILVKSGCCNSDCDSCVLPLHLRKNRTSTRDIVYGALCLAMSFVLSTLTVFRLPFGGSITLVSALPILLYGYFFGIKKSLLVCLGYLLLSLYNPYIVTPWSFILDYVVPSFTLMATGLFAYDKYKANATNTNSSSNGNDENNSNNSSISNKKSWHSKFIIGVAIYFVVRLASHTLAGVLFWTQGVDWGGWSGDLSGFDAWGYSITYNLAFLLPDTVLALVVGIILLRNSHFVKAITK